MRSVGFTDTTFITTIQSLFIHFAKNPKNTNSMFWKYDWQGR